MGTTLADAPDVVLLLVEKPSQAKAIQKIMDRVESVRSKRYFYADFGGTTLCVFPLGGSVVDIDIDGTFTPDRASSVKLFPILPDESETYPRQCILDEVDPKSGEVTKRGKEGICRQLKEVQARHNFKRVILATDPDYEGAALGVEALLFAKIYKKGVSVVAMDISNLNPAALKRELSKALSGKDAYDWRKFSLVGRTRSDLNAAVGIMGSRLLTERSGSFLTFGSQQTRLLERIVSRAIAHEEADQSDYYRIRVTTDIGDFLYIPEEGEKDKTKMEGVLSRLKEKNAMKALSVERKKQLVKSPAWRDGSGVAKAVSEALGQDIDALMDKDRGLIQAMYDKAIMTYPRGECHGVMPLSQLEEQRQIAKVVSQLFPAPRLDLSLVKSYLWYKDGEYRNKKGEIEVINHTPYTIADAETDYQKLSNEEKVVFENAARHVLSVFYPECKRVTTKAIAVFPDYPEYEFVANDTHDIDPGWKEITGSKIAKGVIPINREEFDSGSPIKVKDIVLESYKKKRPPLYTKNSLYEMMKKYKIGAESTYRTHISTILDPRRNFVTIKNGKIHPTDKARKFIAMLPPDAIRVLSFFEKEIAEPVLDGRLGKKGAFAKRNALIEKTYSLLGKSCEGHRKELQDMGNADKQGRGTLPDSACPKCGKPIRETAKAFVCTGGTRKKEKDGWVHSGCDYTLWKKQGGKKAGFEYSINSQIATKLLRGERVKVKVTYLENGNTATKEIGLNDEGRPWIFVNLDNK